MSQSNSPSPQLSRNFTMKLLQLCLVFGLIGFAAVATAAERPNFVFILADDLGFGDLKCYGHPYARTPNLDKLAEQGTRFTQFYVTGVTCCPSRTGFMTGKFPATFKDYPSSHGFGMQITVTELLKQAGYRTGHFGKWHIGPTPKPGTYGIDSINTADEFRSKKKGDERGRDAHIFDDAIGFIEKNKDGPFYVNVWGHVSHFPVNPPQTLVDKFKDVTVKDSDFSEFMQVKFARVRKEGGDLDDGMRRYLADVTSLDEGVGRLLRKLDELGLSQNTIVVFSSDHGAGLGELPKKVVDSAESEKTKRMQQEWNMMGYAGEFRGGKHGMYEGGVRVPFLIRWPGHVPEKTVNTSCVISAIDWLPTLCGITGAKIDAKDFDGEDVSSVWLGKDRERTKPLFWKTNNVRSEIAIRDGNWKLHDPNRKKGDIELYNLVSDPAESINLATKNPALVQQLQAKIEKWNATLPKEYSKADDSD